MGNSRCSNIAGLTVFTALEECIVGRYKLNWGNCDGIKSFGTASINGRRSGIFRCPFLNP
jgi:hypothetical protein